MSLFGFGKKVKKEEIISASSPPLSAAGKVHEDTVFYTMPAKFLVKDNPPFWTTGKIWAVIAVLMLGLLGGVYWLVATANQPAPADNAALPPKSSDAVVLEPSAGQPLDEPSAPEGEEQPAAPEEPPEETPEEEIPPELPPEEEPPVIPPTSAPLPSSLDSDQDGLTDAEEIVYGADAFISDTDGDGYTDQQEVLNGFNPNGSNRLAEAGLSRVYTSTAVPRFTAAYPSSWALQRGNDSGDDIRFIASPDEFVSINLQPNDSQLSILDWYALIAPEAGALGLTIENVGARTGIYSRDRQTFYFIDVNRPAEVFVVNYNSGFLGELNFRTTFEFIIRSVAVTP